METIMTNLNGPAQPPRLPPPTNPARPARGRSPWVQRITLAGVVLGGVGLAAGGYAATAGGDGAGWREGMRLAFAQHAVTRALDGVGASAAQEAKIHDIVAARFAELAPNPEEHAAMRKQALDLLAAPTVDRGAAEKMRADAVAKFDAKSKVFVAGLLDAADQLTPEQRTKLAAQIEAMPPHGFAGGPWGHWGHWAHWGRGGPGGHGPMMGGPQGGPDDGPDGPPDRD
jgi:protein CpxP